MAVDDRSKPPLLVVCGPTGAGKSALALQLAQERPITIISADSRQIYRRFDIGTAKPTAAERAAVPHVGIDLVEPTVRYSSFAWASVAADAIAQATASGRIPLVVGGAGFYLRALITPEPDVQQFNARYLLLDPGECLRQWIAHRVDAMFAGGWLDEVRTLDAGVTSNAPAWQASGYTIIRALGRGDITLPAAREQVIIATRQYAKRQRTWFRHQIPRERVTHVNVMTESDRLHTAIQWMEQ